MKKKIRAFYLLIPFFLISMSGYGQLNQFLIGNYCYDSANEFNKTPASPPDAFTNYTLSQQYFQNMIDAGINTLGGGSFNDTHFHIAESMGLKVIPDISRTYLTSPNIIGFNLKDEPNTADFSSLANAANDVRSRNSNYLIWANLLPSQAFSIYDHVYREEYLQRYINEVRPNVLSFDDYPVFYNLLLNTPESTDNSFLRTLYTFGAKSVENSIPFFYVLTPLRFRNTGYWWDATQTETIEEFRYCIYSALIYGAKGINYWPGFEWMLTHWGPEGDACQLPACKNYYSIRSPFLASTKSDLVAIHTKLSSSSETLLKLNFASAYHFTVDGKIVKTLLSTCTGSGCSEELQSFEFWHGMGGNTTYVDRPGFGILRDEYAKFVFSNPFIPINLISNNLGVAADNMNDFAMSFMTDSDNGIYFWVMNKGLIWGHSFTLNFNLNKVSSYIDELNAPNSSCNPNSSIYLAPGEAKLFKVNKVNNNDKVIVNISNTDYALNYPELSGDYNTSPLVTADSINIGNTVIFEGGTYSSFMAHNIHITNGTHMMSGSHVHLKKYTDCNVSNVSNGRSAHIEDSNPSLEKPKESLDASVYPNPTKKDFILQVNLKDKEEINANVYDSMGKLIHTIKTSTPETTISLEGQPSGIYLVRFVRGDKPYSFKVIKQ